MEIKMSKYYVGIDIGSTASKTVVIDENQVVDAFTLPTGWTIPSILVSSEFNIFLLRRFLW